MAKQNRLLVEVKKTKQAMKIIFLFLAVCLLITGCRSKNPADDIKTTFPLKKAEWKKIDDNGYNSDTYVLELPHGWLVYRSAGFGGGMAFVPRPQEK